MHVLMISYDRNIFVEGSDAYTNALSYGGFMDELHIIIFSRKKHGLEQKKIGDNIHLYPTNGILAVFSIFKAIVIGKNIKNIDIITAQDPFESGLVGYMIKKIKHVPLQIQVHGDFFSTDYWRRESILNGGRATLGEMILRHADCIRVVSKRIEKSLVALGIEKRRIVRNPIAISKAYFFEKEPTTDLHHDHPEHDFIFLSMARFVKVKNLELLIRAFSGLLKKHPKSLLVLVGRGPEKQKLQQMVRELAIEKQVVFKEWTDDPFSLYKTADTYVLSSNYEGWGKAVIEAMVSGLPVIMTNVGCAHEALIDKESGLIVPIGNREKLGHAMATMIEQETLREHIRENAIEIAGQFSTYEEYVDTYRESLDTCLRRIQ